MRVVAHLVQAPLNQYISIWFFLGKDYVQHALDAGIKKKQFESKIWESNSDKSTEKEGEDEGTNIKIEHVRTTSQYF